MNADRIMTTRLFVALFPPPAVVERLDEVIRPLRAEFPAGAIRWTACEQVHLTLNFIGSVEHARVPEFERALANVIQESFELRAAGLGCFPDARRPKILWAGLSGELEPLQSLKKSLDAALGLLGWTPEAREFHPHLTIGRVQRLAESEVQALADFIAGSKLSEFGTWRAHQFDLMRSELRSDGAKYSVLSSRFLEED